tara:strand:+ start:4104 stop:4382 length:279 start_codon:yes stop_codon:yes gene_type:complete
MSEDIRKMIDKVKNFKQFVNESEQKFAFDDDIKYELKRYLEGTVYAKVGKTDERATELMDIHKKFIDNVRDKMSADEIAKRLFDYEKNNLKR